MAGPSSSTLRARLSSEGPPPPSSSPTLTDQHLYQHFRECFSLINGSLTGRKKPDSLMAALGESFAKAGLELHTCVLDRLLSAQTDIRSHITDFSSFFSSILSDIDGLYANIAYPLSATLCHSNGFPRGTIKSHLATVHEKLGIAEAQLCALHDEWAKNIALEDNLRRELVEQSVDRLVAPIHHPAARQVEVFEQEAEQIVQHQFRALDDIESASRSQAQAANQLQGHFKERMQAKTMEMMKFMLAD